MHDAQPFFPFWLGHPSIRKRPQSATIYDIFYMMLGSEALTAHEHDESRDIVQDLLPRGIAALSLTDKVTIPARRAQTDLNGPPVRNCFKNVVTHGENIVDATLQAYIQDVWPQHTHRNMPIIDFIKHVYKYEPDMIPKGRNYSLPGKSVHAFYQGPYEKDSYEHLENIFKELIKQVHPQPGTRPLEIWFNFLREVPPKTNHASFKPDSLASTTEGTAQSWATGIIHGEVKRDSKMNATVHSRDRPIDLCMLNKTPRKGEQIPDLSEGRTLDSDENIRETHERKTRSSSKKRPQSSSQSGRSPTQTQHQYNLRSRAPSAQRTSSLTKTTRASSARNAMTRATSEQQNQLAARATSEMATANNEKLTDKATSTKTDGMAAKVPTRRGVSLDAASSNLSKHLRMNGSNSIAGVAPSQGAFPPFTVYQLQSAKYANELMSHGVRSYGTGWLLEDTSLTLWYTDRMGLVVSEAFDIIKEPHYLLLFVAAVSSASARDLGICPLINVPGNKFDDFKDVKLEINSADTDNGPVSNLKFNVSDMAPIYTEYGALGRGTTVIHASPTKATGKRLGMDSKNNEVLVVKIAWPPANRISEAEYVKTIREGLKTKHADMLKHIVDVKCSLTRSMTEVNLPRAFMGFQENETFDIRELRCMVMKRYEGLEMVDSPEEFKQIFVDVVRAHHWVFETTKLLHRDVSTGNVMFYREGGRVIGVLCDWDQALDEDHPHHEKPKIIVKPADVRESKNVPGRNDGNSQITEGRVEPDKEAKSEDHNATQNTHAGPDEDETKLPKERYRTGTGPFMACALLLAGEVPLHEYRFDLESFFWLLAWFCATFNQKNHCFIGSPSWDHPDLFTIGEKKRSFLENHSTYISTYEFADPSYRELIDNWVLKLRRVFNDASSADIILRNTELGIEEARRFGDEEKEAEYLETYTFDKKRQARSAVTYKKFMRALGEGE